MTSTEQIIAFATPLAVIVSIVLQKLETIKAGRERKVVQEKLVQTNDIVDAKLTVMSASSNGAMLFLMRKCADMAKELAEIHMTPDRWSRYEAAERSYHDYEERQRKILEAIKAQPPVEMPHGK